MVPKIYRDLSALVCLGETEVLKNVCAENSRNHRENVLVLEKQWAYGCCHIGFPKSCYDGKRAKVSGVSRWVEVKDDQSYTKNLQDRPPRVALGNDPKQD